MLSENWLPAIRKAIRDYIIVPAHVDTLKIATTLLNKLPSRESALRIKVSPQTAWADELWQVVDEEVQIGRPFRILIHYADECEPPSIKPTAREEARLQVKSLLYEATEHLQDIESIAIDLDTHPQIRAAIRLANAIAGTLQDPSDILDLCRVFAFMSGSNEVEPRHVRFALRTVLSEIRPQDRRMLAFAMSQNPRDAKFRLTEWARNAERARQTYDVRKRKLFDAGIITMVGRRGTKARYKLTSLARQLADEIDPRRDVWTSINTTE